MADQLINQKTVAEGVVSSVVKETETNSQSNNQENNQGTHKMKKRPHTSPEDFIRAYQKCNSHQEVAEKLNVTQNTVYQRSLKFRKMGINLKMMERKQKSKIDVQDLNALIENL